MASRIRTVDFLPEIFQTEPNKEFLSSTLDQLVNQPKLKPTQGYIGRKTEVGATAEDTYIPESTAERNNYQLEPGVVTLAPESNKIENVVTFPGLLDGLQVNNAIVTKQDRLFDSEYYSWDPFIDFDKFVNFGQYYWLSEGPNSVSVSASAVPVIQNFDVTRTSSGYTVSDEVGNLPTITLLRGGNYTFDVNQLGNGFWIQTTTGTSGTVPWGNQSNREIFGVTNNGDDVGTISFNVPQRNAQSFYDDLPIVSSVDFATNLLFDQINAIPVSEFFANYPTGIDGITQIEGRDVIFLTTLTGADGGWVYGDSSLITDPAVKYSRWRINYTTGDNPHIYLTENGTVDNLTKLIVNYGNEYGGAFFYKNASGFFDRVPLITANLNTLYYQDGTNENFFGTIRIVDNNAEQTLDINEILSSSTYTSTNGVTFTNGLKVRFDGLTNPSTYQGNEYYVEGVGTLIKLLPVTDFVTPEPNTVSASNPFDIDPFDEVNFDATLNAPLTPDYLTINRASPDNNAWSRSNRWFHTDVINKTAEYNKVVPVFDNNNRARRPILEYRSGIKLFNYGTSGIGSVNIIDFSETDAFSNINGTLGYAVDGYSLITGSKIIFAADIDPEVRNKVFDVTFVEFDDSSDPVINLSPADVTSPDVPTNSNVIITSGVTLQGKSYYFDGNNWIDSQDKISVNQAPLFDMFDLNGNSYGDNTYYPGSSFTGTKLFSYAPGTGSPDSVLGFPLKYLTINNVGDIVFDDNLYKDSFTYLSDRQSNTVLIQNGTPRIYSDRTTYTREIGWQTAYNDSVTRQILNFTYAGTDLVLDVEVDSNADIPVKVFVAGEYQLPTQYSYTTNDDGVTVISLNTAPANGTIIEVSFISQTVSTLGYYSVPYNLENNAVNQETQEVTLGTIRNHYSRICQNLSDFTGTIIGTNNTRDLGNIVPYGDLIIQNSSPLTFATTFINSPSFDFEKAVDWNGSRYEKFKAVLMNTVADNDWGLKTADVIFDECLDIINIGKNETSPFYWSDMVPSGPVYTETVYTITPISTRTFNTVETHNFTSANYKGLLVYLNDEQLLGDEHDYTVSTVSQQITISDTITLNVGDVLKVREYNLTYKNYIPSTPAKLGLAMQYLPTKYTDNSYVTPQEVIQGHDGSITVAYGDIRDDVLLEFEKRVYNNLKIPNRYNPNVNIDSVMPGQFRTTDYTLAEVNEILAESFLNWIGSSKLDYRTQTYEASNEFTWNYSTSQNKLDSTLLLGAWRGIYYYLYDTDTPHTTPWLMLGLPEQPDWWAQEYGVAPYTDGNLVLWEDLRDGRIKDPDNTRIDPKYARPQLLEIIPVDGEGNLRSPFETVVGSYDIRSFNKSWVFGDIGPVENVWRRSSSYQFSLQKLLSVTKPAQYFALNADIDLYKYSTEFNQYLYNNRFRINSANVVLYGNGTSKNSYINWIIDYNRLTGLDSTTTLSTKLGNIDIRLCYRMGGYSDKRYLKIFTEKSSPNSENTSLLLPDESYQLLLYKNPTQTDLQYSSVIVQKTGGGYTVNGYSKDNTYFTIYPSIINGNFTTIRVGGTSIRINQDFDKSTTVRIPYGYEWKSINSAVDFLVSYGAYLEDQGFIFDSTTNGVVLNWAQMAEELVYWNNQGWQTGSIINLNPNADKLSLITENQVVESITDPLRRNVLVNQNNQVLDPTEYFVERNGNTFKLQTLTSDTINLFQARLTQYEHIVVLDNASLFKDLIYEPSTGARQGRLLLNGYITYDWDGTVEAQGFILNQDNIKEWDPNVRYSKGQIVLYKNEYWSAGELVGPAQKFDFSKWIKSDYNKISKGMLPNLATKADLIRNYYDVNTANLETDGDLLAFGLIGFRPREYMTNLGLNDISQVNLYKQFLGTKGTIQAAEIFTQAQLQKETAEYNITENWALRRASYGATDSRAYIEIQLNEADNYSNPSTIEILPPLETSEANQSVYLDDLWKTSYPVTNVNVLPALDETAPDSKLPSAGYVNWDDADVKLFTIDQLRELTLEIENIGIGSTIWVAKSNSYDWNIYRCNLVLFNINQVKDNLNGTCTVTFSGNHGLTTNDILVIKSFAEQVNGAYSIQAVPSLKTVVISLSLAGQTTSITGSGVPFVLESVRVAQPSDISNLSFATKLVDANSVWVDDGGNDRWAVYEKSNPFSAPEQIRASSPQIDSNFGSAVTQGFLNQGMLVGASGYENSTLYTGDGTTTSFSFEILRVTDATQVEVTLAGSVQTLNVDYTVTITAVDKLINFVTPPAAASIIQISVAGGAVYTYNKTNRTNYVQTSLLTLGIPNTIGFGTDIDSGSSEWGIVGAPSSYGKQGYSAVINRSSSDGIYTVSQILVPTPVNNYETLGNQDSSQFYDFSSQFTTTDASKIGVIVDDVVQVQDVDWQLVGSTQIEFFERVTPGASVSIFLFEETGKSVVISNDERWMYIGGPGNDVVRAYQKVIVQNQSVTYDGDGRTTEFSISGAIVVDDDSAAGGIGEEQLSVVRNNIVQTPGVDYEYDAPNIVFTTAPNVLDTIRILRKQSKTWNVGTVKEYTFNVEDLYTITDIYSFVVRVNGVIQRPNIDYIYVDDSTVKEIQFPNGVQNASLVVRSDNHWKLVDTILSPASGSNQFGYSVSCTTDGRQLTIGCPEITVDGNVDAGRVYMYDRGVERFYITNTNQRSYTLQEGAIGSVSVKLNGNYLLPTPYNIGGEFTQSGDTITLASTVDIAIGDILEIENNIFRAMQTIDSNDSLKDAKFGFAVDQCLTNCSLYIGAPYSDQRINEGGIVERWVNEPRLFGTTTSTIDSTLNPGNSIRINNTYVEVSAPATFSSSNTYASGVFVNDGSNNIYRSVQAVPASSSLTDRTYWAVSSWPESFANDINQANVVNVQASFANGFITISSINLSSQFEQLSVLPGLGSTYNSLGFTPMRFTQTIFAPLDVQFGHFGWDLAINSDAATLVVGAPDSTAARDCIFDNGTTILDGNGTAFVDQLLQSGVAYTYDYLPAANPSVSNPGKFVYGSQLYDNSLYLFDSFGKSVSINEGIVVAGSPGSDLGDSSGDYGRAVQFTGSNGATWTITYNETTSVDVTMMNSIFAYDRLSNKVLSYFDYIDPLQGKILGVARENIDYIGGIDPANYNVGSTNNTGQTWDNRHVGEMWWDTSTIRFIDYHQDDVQYRAKRWGQLFTGSRVDVYQWIESSVPPSQYNGPGYVYNTTSYVVGSELNVQGVFVTQYYFWVAGITEVDRSQNKTLSSATIAQYIENPRSSGLPYVAPIGQNSVAIYNASNLMSASDTILHIEFDRIKNNDNVHVEYDLIQSESEDSFLDAGSYRKLLDSFTGEDTVGNQVPDAFLPIADKYGNQFRPRQSFFIDRFEALKNYIVRTNTIFALYPLAEIRTYPLLESQEPEPTEASGEWNKRLNTYAELTYQDLRTVADGYKYLIASDETVEGLWTIYEKQSNNTATLYRVQNYDTNKYWSYVDWVQTGYNTSQKPIAEVSTYNDLLLLTGVNNGDSAKVLSNSANKYEYYQYNNGTWTRVILENGTIQISAEVYDYSLGGYGYDADLFDSLRFDQNPITETRKILQAINDEILINDLAIYRNELLILTFNYILSEQMAPSWLFKTSLIDVSHKIRDLLPYPVYNIDNQDFVINYIDEVKPYHSKIREFSLVYDGTENYNGNITDFDVPAYFDASTDSFVSPQLGTAPDSVWQTWPWSSWYTNYTYVVGSIVIDNAGEGYTVAPTLTVSGTATRQAELEAVVNSAGQIVRVDIVDEGEGYTTTPVITLTGGNGTGGQLSARLVNNKVRSLDVTLKFDRYEYTSNVIDWEKNVYLEEGTLVRYNNKVYEVSTTTDSSTLYTGASFDPDYYTLVDQSTLSAADRIMGLYQPGVDDPGRELALVLSGIDYPGVQITGPSFSENTGYDVGNFDINPFDNIEYGPEGLPTYSDSILDSIYQSSFTDTYLGRRSTDVIVDGGEFIDTYSSHAPQELVPGSAFDTLDMVVNTRPGSDWRLDGHGFLIKKTGGVASTFSGGTTAGLVLDIDDLMKNPVAVRVENNTSKRVLIPGDDYTVNWWNGTVTVESLLFVGNVNPGDDVGVIVYGVGGGNQLLKESFNGESVGNSLTIEVQYTDVEELVVWHNGEIITSYTIADPIEIQLESPATTGYVVRVQYTAPNGTVVYEDHIGDGSTLNYGIADDGTELDVSSNGTLAVFTGPDTSSLTELVPTEYTTVRFQQFYYTTILFTETYGKFDEITVLALGSQSPTTYSYSYPQTEHFAFDGSTLSFELSNSTEGQNIINMVVEVDGIRLRPAEAVEYTSDGSSLGPYYLPTTGQINQGTISDNEVIVFVDGVQKFVFADFTISDWDGSSDRYVEFNEQPDVNAQIIVAVTTAREYTLNGQTLTLRVTPTADSDIAVTTFADTRQQNILTKVFQGPTQIGTQINDPFDPLSRSDSLNGDPGSFDYATTNNTQWSFDYGSGVVQLLNDFDLERTITNDQRLMVSLNGQVLVGGRDYQLDGTTLVLGGSIISGTDVLAVTMFTNSTTPESLQFRIFQDMLENQKLLRITQNNSTALLQDLGLADDTIYVVDAGKLGAPALEENVFGQIIIGAEKITYRTRDLVTNTLSGLRRGVGGTGVTTHSSGDTVSDVGKGQQLPSTYQITTYQDDFVGDGSTYKFVCENVTVDTSVDSTELSEAVRVRVAGTELLPSEYTVTQTQPRVEVQLDLTTAPGAGQTVEIYIEKATVMYSQSTGYTTQVQYNDINWSAASESGISRQILKAGLGTSAIQGFLDTIASDGYAYGDFSTNGAINAADALYAAQYGQGVLAPGAIKTRIEEVFIPALKAERALIPDIYNTYFLPETVTVYTGETASNGVPLQEQQTNAAQFLRGEI